MVSNDVAALGPGESCEALLLTPKARVIAPLVVLRRGHEDFLLLTEPDLGERVRAELVRSRFAAKAEIESEEHTSHVVFGGEGIPTGDYGEPAAELLDAGLEPTVSTEELELLRIRAGTPAWGKEIDDRVLPAEAGLTERAVSFTKGCYPGQEPIARLHYRGHANRGLRVLTLEAASCAGDGARLRGQDGRADHERRRDGDGAVALAYVRREVPAGRRARPRVVDRRCRYLAEMATPPDSPQGAVSAARTGVVGAAVVGFAFFDSILLGFPIALLAASFRPSLVYAAVDDRRRSPRDRLLPLDRSTLGGLVFRQRRPDRAAARVDAGEPPACAPRGVAPAWLGPLVRLRRGSGEPDPRRRPGSRHRRRARRRPPSGSWGGRATRSRTSQCGRSWVGRSPAPSAPRASPRQSDAPVER